MWTCSQCPPDRGHEQVEEGCRSTASIPHLLDNRSTSSSARKAGVLVPPSSCLDGGPHGWVPVDTHSTPVLTSVRTLWGYVVYEPNTPQEHAQLAHGSRARVQDHEPRTSQPSQTTAVEPLAQVMVATETDSRTAVEQATTSVSHSP